MGLALRKVWTAFAFAALLAAAPLAHALADDAAPTGLPSAAAPFGVRFGGDDTRTRLVLDLGETSPGRVMVIKGEGRLEIDLAAVTAAGGEGAGHGLVRHWAATAAADGARVSVDLAPSASIERRFAIPPSAEVAHWRYVVDLVGGDPMAALLGGRSAAAPVQAQVAPQAPGQSVLADAGRGKALTPELYPSAPARGSSPSPVAARPAMLEVRTPKVVVIDPGHGGKDTGAQSLVLNEKDITLPAALALKARLEREGGRYRVVLTRSTDVFIPLEERVRIARAAKADLFISLHADSAGQDPTPHGATVYTVSDHGVTRVNEVLGAHEWFAHAGDRRADPGVGQLLLDLTQRSTRNRSAEFASILINHLGRDIDLLPRSHRDASYFVLLAPDVPAVLLEMGFVTNPADQLRLTDPEQRREMMSEVGDAIDDYFAPKRQVAQEDAPP